MADTSPKWGITEPAAARTDAADVPLYVRNIVAALEAKGVQYGQGTLASRPSAGVQGRIYVATDQTPNAAFYDTGAAWVALGGQATGSVGTNELADNGVTLAKMADNSVSAAEIVDGSITSAEIADGTIVAADVASALKPSAGASAATESLRALGTAAGTAAAGSHAAQHKAAGADPLVIDQNMLSAAVAALLYQPGDLKMVAQDIIAGTNEPAGWLLCDGRAVSQTTYAALYAVITTQWNIGGEGAGNFRLPDFRGRSPMGKGQFSGGTNRLVGQLLGAETHTLDATQIPNHGHSVSLVSNTTGASIVAVAGHTHGMSQSRGNYQFGTAGIFAFIVEIIGGGGVYNTGVTMDTAGGHGHTLTDPGHSHTVNQTSIGGGLSHPNVHPVAVCSILVKT